jgi:hypothetical protein
MRIPALIAAPALELAPWVRFPRLDFRTRKNSAAVAALFFCGLFPAAEDSGKQCRMGEKMHPCVLLYPFLLRTGSNYAMLDTRKLFAPREAAERRNIWMSCI